MSRVLLTHCLVSSHTACEKGAGDTGLDGSWHLCQPMLLSVPLAPTVSKLPDSDLVCSEPPSAHQLPLAGILRMQVGCSCLHSLLTSSTSLLRQQLPDVLCRCPASVNSKNLTKLQHIPRSDISLSSVVEHKLSIPKEKLTELQTNGMNEEKPH